jgi:hypothetical protein
MRLKVVYRSLPRNVPVIHVTIQTSREIPGRIFPSGNSSQCNFCTDALCIVCLLGPNLCVPVEGVLRGRHTIVGTTLNEVAVQYLGFGLEIISL